MARRIASFGVFDSLVGWACGSTESLTHAFATEAHRDGLLPCGPYAYRAARREAALGLHLDSADLPLTPEALWRALAAKLGLDPARIDALRSLELRRVRLTALPLPCAAGRLAAARRRGMRVVYTVPLGIEPETVAGLLDRLELRAGDEAVYSPEPGAGDVRGVFARILRYECVEPEDVVHRGRVSHADLLAALDAGIRLEAAPEAAFNRFEQILDQAAPATSGLAGALAAASRQARLEQGVGSPDEAARRDVAAAVAAPAVLGYLLWAISQAADQGLRRLLVTWPDGSLMLPLARRVAELLGRRLAIGELDLVRRPLDEQATETWLGCLRRNGLLDGPPTGLLELSPSPRIHATVTELCASAGCAPPAWFCFSARAAGPLEPGVARYLDDGRLSLRPAIPAGVEALLAECTTPCPMPGSPGGTVLRVAEHLRLSASVTDRRSDIRDCLAALFVALWAEPMRAERAAWPMVGGSASAATLRLAAAG